MNGDGDGRRAKLAVNQTMARLLHLLVVVGSERCAADLPPLKRLLRCET